MTQAPKDNTYNWLFFLLGALMFSQGASALYSYFSTGKAVFRHFKSIPFNLEGHNAALMYGAFFVIGALFMASGIKGFLRK